MVLPRFFKIFLSHFSSESMLIPPSYYDELPTALPKTALIQGSGGCFWTVAMVKKRDEVYFGQGWSKFVEDTRLRDGDVLTFLYDGSRNFKVSIYGSTGCKEARVVAQVVAIDDDKDDSVSHLTSEDTNTSSEPDIAKTVPKIRNKGKKKVVEDSDESFALEDSNSSDTSPEPEMPKRVPRTRSTGKKKVAVEDSDESFASEDSDSSDTSPEAEMAKTVRRTRNKGKKKVAVEDSDGSFVAEDSNNRDSSYSPPTIPYMTPTVANPRRKGTSRSANSVVGSTSYRPRRERKKGPTIKNPEAYLDDPKNVWFETFVKNRTYELLIQSQLVKDYSLKFQDSVYYIDNHEEGNLEARTAKWQDHRVCIKKWHRICKRNGFKKGDPVLCELFRKDNIVYAVKIHVVTERD